MGLVLDDSGGVSGSKHLLWIRYGQELGTVPALGILIIFS